jgi:integrase/recombinase XerD
MTELRKRMLEDMQLRNYSPESQRSYIDAVARFARYFNKSPEKLGAEEIRSYQLYLLKEKKIGWSTLGLNFCALKFLYTKTLGQPWVVEKAANPKVPKPLPLVLSREEVVRVLDLTANLKHRAFLATLYSTGARAAEARLLRVEDIDSQRMLVFIRHGKGGQQRYVMLSTQLLEILRAYWRWRKPQEWLFPSARFADRPLDFSSIRKMCKEAGQRAGLGKCLHPHTLRHCYATHLLEDGVNLRRIQVLLGHASIKTTAKYLLVSQQTVQETVSPLDRLTLHRPHLPDSDGRRR